MCKMNNVDSDLEEGEILDDSSSSPCDSGNNVRELPRRYIVQNNKGTHIHKHRKRDCKNAIRYHAKKLAKLKSPSKFRDIKKHHKSSMCSYDKSSKGSNKYGSVAQKHMLPKYCHSSPKELLPAKKDSLKDVSNQKVKLKPKQEQNLSKFEKNDFNNEKMHKREEIKNEDFQSIDRNMENSKQHNQNSDDLSNLAVVNSEIKLSNVFSDNSSEAKCEESEDEEELRRIALATFSRRKADAESSECLVKSEANCKSLQVNESTSLSKIKHFESDNYEVVDMDVDEDTEALIEVFEEPLGNKVSEFTEDLYIIDTKPFNEDCDKKTDNEVQIINNSSDEDFEAAILRAELIESMYRKKCLLDDEDDHVGGDSSNKQNSVHVELPIVPKKRIINNYQKPNNKFYQKHVKPKHVVRKTLVKRSEKLCYNVSKSVAPTNQLQINKKAPERLIISLNEESSSEESESPEENVEKDVEPENPLASIEALISDCRQKSESKENKQEDVKHVSKAVACLSKAQQEEYQTLMKILAEKEKLPVPTETIQNKNGSTNSALNDLKLMEQKLIKFKAALQKKNESMTLLSKEINSKKFVYLKSKLSAQFLKERYLAAEKTRKAHLCAWSKACGHFRNVKKTVSNLESKINELQTLCSKLGACIQGKTYNLPSLPTNSNSNV